MATSYLYKTFGSAGTRTKYTISMWFKRGELGSAQSIFTAGTDASHSMFIGFNSSDRLYWNSYSNAGASYDYFLDCSRLFRDPAAWYHIVCAYDSTQVTSSNRQKIYVNGVQETAFETETYSGSYSDYAFNNIDHEIGQDVAAGSRFFSGSMAHYHGIDGTTYQPSDFGETDSTSGIWVAKNSPSVTYGTNGFFLKFQDTSAFGDDSSGNTNDFTVGGTMTQTKDTPDNNFCTMNPLDNYYAASTFTNGNTTVQTASSPYCFNTATMGLSAGLWYWEVKIAADSSTGNEFQNGISDTTPTGTTVQLGDTANAYDYKCANGKIKNNGTEYAYGTTSAVGDILGMYLDLTANKFYVAKNGVVMNSGTGYSINAISSTSGFYNPAYNFGNGSQQGTCNFNFGNGYFGTTVVTSGVADAGGEGTFEYDPSAGTFDSASKDFRAICTKNIKAYG